MLRAPFMPCYVWLVIIASLACVEALDPPNFASLGVTPTLRFESDSNVQLIGGNHVQGWVAVGAANGVYSDQFTVSARQPLWVANDSPNGFWGSINFNGNSDPSTSSLMTSSSICPVPGTAPFGAMTIFFVGKLAARHEQIPFHFTASYSTPGMMRSLYIDGNNYYSLFAIGAGWSTTTTFTPTQYIIWTMTVSSGYTANHWVRTGAAQDAFVGSVGMSGLGTSIDAYMVFGGGFPSMFGGGNDYSHASTFAITALLVFPTDLSPGSRQSVSDYLYAKYFDPYMGHGPDCGTPPTPLHGTAPVCAGGTLRDATCAITCLNSYVLIGASTITCQSSGAWDSAPSCIANCSTPASIVNGVVACGASTLAGATCNTTCSPHYDRFGAASIVCQPDTFWSPAPVCTANCSIPPTPTHALSPFCPNGTLDGASCSMTCLSSVYELFGADNITCQSDATWTSSPLCIANCHTPPVPGNGSIGSCPSTYESAVCSLGCDSGFALVGPAVILCQSDGNWSGAPTCIPDCGTPPTPINGTALVCSGHLLGANCSMSCVSGCTLVGPSTIACLATSLWTPAPQCIVDCGVPPTPTNGLTPFCTGGTLLGANCTMSCPLPYVVVGPDSITCQTDGHWSENPTCIVSCGVPTTPLHGNPPACPDGTYFGDACTHSCITPYALVGPNTVTCLISGLWSGAPNCTAPATTGITSGASTTTSTTSTTTSPTSSSTTTTSLSTSSTSTTTQPGLTSTSSSTTMALDTSSPSTDASIVSSASASAPTSDGAFPVTTAIAAAGGAVLGILILSVMAAILLRRRRNPPLSPTLYSTELVDLQSANQFGTSRPVSMYMSSDAQFLRRFDAAQIQALIDNGTKIAEGGGGIVYSVVLPIEAGAGSQPLALKRLHKKEECIKEARVLWALQADPIRPPGILDVMCSWPQHSTILMELVEGPTLTAFLGSNEKLTLRQKVNFLEQTVDVLEYFEQLELAHLDIKNGNLIVTMTMSGPLIKVIDYGEAKSTVQVYAPQDLYAFTPRFSDPEFARFGLATSGKLPPVHVSPSTIDLHAVDVFSFGIVMWSLVAQQPRPYPHLTNEQLDEKLVAEASGLRPFTPPEIPPDVPAVLQAVMRSCWGVPSKRPTFAEISVVIDDFATQSGIERVRLRPITRPPKLRSQVQVTRLDARNDVRPAPPSLIDEDPTVRIPGHANNNNQSIVAMTNSTFNGSTVVVPQPPPPAYYP